MTPSMSPKRGRWLAWLGILLLWQALSCFFPPVVLPGPLATLQALSGLVASPDFYIQLGTTLWRGLAAFSGALLIGIFLGLLMGWKAAFYQAFYPMIVLATNIPPVAWIALLLIWLGMGNGPPLLVVLATTTPLVAVQVAEGVRDLDARLLEMATVFHLSRPDRLRHIIFPALSGQIFAAALLALGFTWRALVMAEFLGSTNGLGYKLSWARQNLDTDLVLAYLVVIVLVSSLLEALLRWLFDRFRRWEQGPHPLAGEMPHHHGDAWHTHPPLAWPPDERGM